MEKVKYMRNSHRQVRVDLHELTCTNSPLTVAVTDKEMKLLEAAKYSWEEYPKGSGNVVARPFVRGKQMYIKLGDFLNTVKEILPR